MATFFMKHQGTYSGMFIMQRKQTFCEFAHIISIILQLGHYCLVSKMASRTGRSIAQSFQSFPTEFRRPYKNASTTAVICLASIYTMHSLADVLFVSF